MMVGRGAKRKGTKYFGPYSHAWAIRDTVDQLLRVFPMRSCSNGVFKRSGQIGRPCLLGYIDKCSAPCVGNISAEDHRAIVDDFCDFIGGNTNAFIKRIRTEMYAASDALDFEKAARLRDDLGAMEKALEKQAVVFGDGTSADVIALAEDPLEVAVQIFYVRGGRIRGQRGWVADRVEEGGTAELVEDFLLQLYGGAETDEIPREILVPQLPPDPGTIEALLSDLRGSRVRIRVPQRGDKRSLQETVARNAGQALVMHKTKRAVRPDGAQPGARGDPGRPRARRRAAAHRVLRHLQPPGHRGGGLDGGLRGRPGPQERVPPLRDQGHRGADSAVGQNDVAHMHQVITRRFRRLLDEQARSTEVVTENGPMLVDPETGRPRKFAYAPGLVVVDGGPPQVAAAAASARRARHRRHPRVRAGQAPGGGVAAPPRGPVILNRSSEALYLLQRVRDEAHRFAITHHRSRRSKSMVESLLDDVPGLGEVRRKTLLKHFGSLRKLRAATVEEIAMVPGIGDRTAIAIKAAVEQAEPQDCLA